MLGRVGTSYRQHLLPLPQFLAVQTHITTRSKERHFSRTACSPANATATARAALSDPPSSSGPEPSCSRHPPRRRTDLDVQGGHTPKLKQEGEGNGQERVGPRPERQPDAPSRELISLVDGLATRHESRESLKAHPSVAPYIQEPDKVRRTATLMAASSRPQRALRFLTFTHMLGIKHHVNSYENVSHRLAGDGRWAMIISVVQLAKRQLSRVSLRLLNWKLRAYVETRHYAELGRMLDEFQEEGFKPTRRTYHLLVSAHLQNHDVAKAKQCLQWMHDAGFPVDASTHAQVVSVYRTLGPDEFVANRAFEALRDIGDLPAAVTLNGLMQICLDGRDITGALRLLSLFDRPNSSPDPSPPPPAADDESEPSNATTFSTRIFTATLSKRPSAKPDAATFTMLIEHMVRLGDLPRALLTLEQMIVAGIEPDTRTAAALIRAHYAAEDTEGAVALAATICVNPTVLHAAFVRLGAPRRLEERHRLLPNLNHPDVHLFNSLLEGVLRTCGLNGMVVVLRIMHACKIVPNSATIETFLSHLLHVERARPREIIRVLRALLASGVRPTLKHYHTIMASVMREERFVVHGRGWDKIAARFSRNSLRQDSSVVPEDRVSSVDEPFHPTAGVRFARKLRYQSLVRPVFDTLSSTHTHVDRATMALRIKHDAVVKGDLEEARRVFQSMLAAGMHPNEYHFAALMEGCVHAGNMPAAMNAMDAAVQAGIEPNVVMFTILIAGYARHGEPDIALRMFQKMIQAGVSPDVPAVDALCSAYFAVGAYALARRTLLQLWPHVKPMPPDIRDAPLKTLAQLFRSRDGERKRGEKPPAKRLSGPEQRMLRWKLRKIVAVWQTVWKMPRKVRRVRREGRAAIAGLAEGKFGSKRSALSRTLQ